MANENALWLSATYAIPTNINLRAENHGPDEKISAVDVSITAMMQCDVLDQIEAGSAALWRRTLWNSTGDIVELNLNGPIKFKRKCEGIYCTLTKPSATGAKNQIILKNVKVRKFAMVPKGDWSIELSFQIQTDLDDRRRQLPWLNDRFLDGSVDVSFEGATQSDLEDEEISEHTEPVNTGADGEGHQAFPQAVDGTPQSNLSVV